MSQPFNPIYGMPTKFYYDLQTADAAYETLPGNTLATAQNDGIGAVLDLKRYKERIEKNSDPTFQNAGADWSRTGTGWTFSVGSAYMNGPVDGPGDMYDSDFMPTAGKLYEAEATFGDSNGETCYFRAVGGAGSYKAFQPAPGATVRMLLVADGTVPVALRGSGLWEGTVTAFHVREIPGYHAVQSLAAAQPVLNIENGIRSALFDGVDDRLVVPNSTDQFNFLHDGTGGELHACARVTDMSADRMLVANNSGTSSNTGIDLRIRPNGVVRFAVTRGIVGEQSALNLPAGSAVVGEIVVWGIRYDAGTLRIYKNGVEVGATAQSYPPATADAHLDLTIGGPQPGSGTFSGDIYSVAPVQGILSDYQRQRLATYMLRRAGA